MITLQTTEKINRNQKPENKPNYKMIKRGDKAKGFRFKTSTNTYFVVHWNNQMEKFIGVEGIVKGVRPEINEIVISFMVTTRLNGFIESHSQHWTYPLDEYLTLQRDMKLIQLGI